MELHHVLTVMQVHLQGVELHHVSLVMMGNQVSQVEHVSLVM